MATIKRKLPRDSNQRAKAIVDLATGNAGLDLDSRKNSAAVALGRLGGLKGGLARAAALSPKKRSKIAKAAAKARWGQAHG
jgi:hypothetical protein